MAIDTIGSNETLPMRVSSGIPIEHHTQFLSFFVFDPISLIGSLIIISFFRKKIWSIPIAAIISTITNEIFLSLIQYNRDWTDDFYRQLLTSLIYACAAYGLLKLKDKKRQSDEKKYLDGESS